MTDEKNAVAKNENAVADVNVDAETLRMLNNMASTDDAGGSGSGLPTLKINYDPDAKYPRGTWVIGQKKDEAGNITEQGEAAKGLVILLARNRWSFYNQKDTGQNCNSPFYLRGEMVQGSNYGYVCGKSCPKRAKDINPRCKCQIVLFGKALTAENEYVDCIAYMGGASYMPVQHYLETIERAKVKGGYVSIPLFARVTVLDVEKKQNEGVKYFQADLKPGPMFTDRDQLMYFSKAREEALTYIGAINNTIEQAKKPANGDAPPAATPANSDGLDAMPPVDPTQAQQGASEVMDAEVTTPSDPPPWDAASVPPFENPTSEASPAPDNETAAPSSPSDNDDDDFDLVGAIDKLIG